MALSGVAQLVTSRMQVWVGIHRVVDLKFIAQLLEPGHSPRWAAPGTAGWRGRAPGRDTPRAVDAVPEPEGQLVGVAGQVEVEAVLQQGLELDAQQPPLGQHGAPLLHVPAEVGQGTG